MIVRHLIQARYSRGFFEAIGHANRFVLADIAPGLKLSAVVTMDGTATPVKALYTIRG